MKADIENLLAQLTERYDNLGVQWDALNKQCEEIESGLKRIEDVRHSTSAAIQALKAVRESLLNEMDRLP